MYGMGDISKIVYTDSKIDHHDHRLDTGTSMMKETKNCLNWTRRPGFLCYIGDYTTELGGDYYHYKDHC